MNKVEGIQEYSKVEEQLNIGTHALGFVLSAIGLVFLVRHAVRDGGAIHIISFTVFGLSLLILYAASTLYHRATKPERRTRLRIVDHTAIYVLIAGTYTPFTLVTLQGTTGWILFGVTWGMALIGMVLKLFFTGKYDIISTIMYVLMGWLIVFAINPLINNLSTEGLQWLFAGGVSYTVGAVLYSIRRLPFNHAIFHVCVLGGSFCHFMAVYFYVLPV